MKNILLIMKRILKVLKKRKLTLFSLVSLAIVYRISKSAYDGNNNFNL